MITRFLQYIFGTKKQDSIEGTDLWDSTLFEGLMFDAEGKVVGTTGTIDPEKQIITQTAPYSYSRLRNRKLTDISRGIPCFDNDKTIIHAARGTAFVVVELMSGKQSIGTAFFVTPKLLLTAGHLFTKHNDITRIRIVCPGTKEVDLQELNEGKVATVDCTIVENLHTRRASFEKDIALIEAVGYNAASSLSLSTDEFPVNAVVDIVGYPAPKESCWIEKHHGFKDGTTETTKTTAETLLPSGHLTVTRGLTVTRCPVESIDIWTVFYGISTCKGMSGSPLLYEGKVYGINDSCFH